MIKSGYYEKNQNLTKSCDFTYAFLNYQSPMLDEVRNIIKSINY